MSSRRSSVSPAAPWRWHGRRDRRGLWARRPGVAVMSPRGARHVGGMAGRCGDGDGMRRAGRASSPRPSTPGRSPAPTGTGVRDGAARLVAEREAELGDPWVAPARPGGLDAGPRRGGRPHPGASRVGGHPSRGVAPVAEEPDGRESSWTPVRREAATVIARAVRVVLGVLALLVAPVTQADLRDLGTYGPTCPVPASPIPPSGVRLRIDPRLARVAAPAEAAMPVALGRRTYVVPVRWPAGAPPVVAFVGHDAGSLAVVRSLPPGTPVYVLPSEGEHGLETIRQACRACRVAVAGTRRSPPARDPGGARRRPRGRWRGPRHGGCAMTAWVRRALAGSLGARSAARGPLVGRRADDRDRDCPTRAGVRRRAPPSRRRPEAA